jgi:hypothetical protein
MNLSNPKTIEEAATALLEMLPKADIERIAAMPRHELIALHFSLGAWIRNQLMLWETNTLPISKFSYSPHPDDISSSIIQTMWNQLQPGKAP